MLLGVAFAVRAGDGADAAGSALVLARFSWATLASSSSLSELMTTALARFLVSADDVAAGFLAGGDAAGAGAIGSSLSLPLDCMGAKKEEMATCLVLALPALWGAGVPANLASAGLGMVHYPNL